jgi:hypothetical protein
MDETTVRSMLAAAGLPASDAEVAALTAAYPIQRAGVDELYTAPEVRYLDPALRFRADAVAPGVDWAD